MLIVSCDPGLTGAISLIDSARGLLECEDIPTCKNGILTGAMQFWVDVMEFEDLIGEWSRKHKFAEDFVRGAIERPIPMPTLPAQTIASQFDSFGTLRSAICLNVNQMHIINPQEWKKIFGLDADKEAARNCALRLYPNAPIGKKKHHNRADSILIGHHVLRQFH